MKYQVKEIIITKKYLEVVVRENDSFSSSRPVICSKCSIFLSVVNANDDEFNDVMTDIGWEKSNIKSYVGTAYCCDKCK